MKCINKTRSPWFSHWQPHIRKRPFFAGVGSFFTASKRPSGRRSRPLPTVRVCQVRTSTTPLPVFVDIYRKIDKTTVPTVFYTSDDPPYLQESWRGGRN